MKKLFILSALLVLGLTTYSWAEISADAYSGKNNNEQGVFIDVYNNAGVQMTKNTVAILDTTGVLTDTKIGTYVTIPSTSDSIYTLGVVDQDIMSASVGRVCVRGPHQVLVSSQATVAAGTILGTASGLYANPLSGTIGYARAMSVADGTGMGRLGVAIGESQATPASIWWVWVNPYAHQ
jgi:hypothetical protein